MAILSYKDLIGQRHIVPATITTNYSQPMLVVNGQAIDNLSWILVGYKIEQASRREQKLLAKFLENITF